MWGPAFVGSTRCGRQVHAARYARWANGHMALCGPRIHIWNPLRTAAEVTVTCKTCRKQLKREAMNDLRNAQQLLERYG